MKLSPVNLVQVSISHSAHLVLIILGQFKKYVNNDGQIDPSDDTERLGNTLSMADALVHFSYSHSNHRMLLVDVQGVECQLTDPEISTLEQNDFCIGNCGKEAFQLFFFQHKCNEFCEALLVGKVDAAQF